MKDNYVYKIVLTGVFIAIAVALGLFTRIQVTESVRITFSEPFLYFIGYSISPLFCALAFGIYDILLYLMRPTGGFIILFTATAVFKGLLFGILIYITKKFNKNKFSKLILLLSFLLILIGGVTIYLIFTNSLEALSTYILVALITILLGILFFFMFVFIRNIKLKEASPSFLLFLRFVKFFIICSIVGITGTLINAKILQVNLLGTDTPFMIIAFPKIISSFIIATYNALVLTIITNIYDRYIMPKISSKHIKKEDTPEDQSNKYEETVGDDLIVDIEYNEEQEENEKEAEEQEVDEQEENEIEQPTKVKTNNYSTKQDIEEDDEPEDDSDNDSDNDFDDDSDDD